MAKSKDTLSSLFAPPRDNLIGISTVLCGYSADVAFIEFAVRQFTRVPPASRQVRGSVDWTLMLDPGHPMLNEEHIPGVLQLRPCLPENKGLQHTCMHAKVALLSFGRARMGLPTFYRLIVSTGNWTVASARHQIEMVWHLDIDLQAAPSISDLNELWAVADFFCTLMKRYQSNGLLACRASELLAQALINGRQPTSINNLRFISSLTSDTQSGGALLDQLALRLTNRSVDNNYLVCGSGFFEQSNNSEKPPDVLEQIEKVFVDSKILTKSADKIVVSGAQGADQLMVSYHAKTLKKWTLCRPRDPGAEEIPRSLHAKFIFMARSRNVSLANGMLYLGSGNLSVLGLLLAPPKGNVEAGVLIDASEIETERKLKQFIPLGSAYKEGEIEQRKFDEQPVDEELPRTPIPPSPILAFVIESETTSSITLKILWDNVVAQTVDVLPTGHELIRVDVDQTHLVLNSVSLPRVIEIQWKHFRHLVPCLNKKGEFKRQMDLRANFGSWLDQLRGYPDTWNDPAPEDEITETDDGDSDRDLTTVTAGAQWDQTTGSRDFPAHTAMMLIEAIAERNGFIEEEQSADWLHYLKHLLVDMNPLEQIEKWRSLNVNFLAILLSTDGFAPDWQYLKPYTDLINEVASVWKLNADCTLELE